MKDRWLCLAMIWLGQSLADAGTEMAPVPLERVSPVRRESVKSVIDRPTLSARGPGESFLCQPSHYYWFLDHPDRAVVAWRRLGAKCVTIQPRAENLFGWQDDHGSEVVWETVFNGPYQRVWYAEGKVKSGPLMPAIPVKAVVVLNHTETRSTAGNTLMYHQADIYVHTDSKSAATVTKLLGNQAGKMAEQGLGQLQLFFSGLSWYLDRHPDQTDRLLRD